MTWEGSSDGATPLFRDSTTASSRSLDRSVRVRRAYRLPGNDLYLRSGILRGALLAFNTPFFPEILVASSVLAEGVDLHLNCRHIIHYDLSWNPSTIEQRTGRVDRLGAKAEQVKQPINVFLPFVAGTQDEKMFRVVTDRERWFQVVMGEDYRLDEAATDKIAERVPLPEAAAAALAFRLEVFDGELGAPEGRSPS